MARNAKDFAEDIREAVNDSFFHRTDAKVRDFAFVTWTGTEAAAAFDVSTCDNGGDFTVIIIPKGT